MSKHRNWAALAGNCQFSAGLAFFGCFAFLASTHLIESFLEFEYLFFRQYILIHLWEILNFQHIFKKSNIFHIQSSFCFILYWKFVTYEMPFSKCFNNQYGFYYRDIFRSISLKKSPYYSQPIQKEKSQIAFSCCFSISPMIGPLVFKVGIRDCIWVEWDLVLD